MIFALIYLIFVLFSLGFTVWSILKVKEEDNGASLIMYIATGLIVFVHATAILGFLHLSTWYVYVILALAMLAIASRKGGLAKLEMPKLSKEWIIVLIIFIAHFGIYASGASGYPYLEDDDPWEHAAAVRFVSVFSTYLQPDHTPIHYLAPYSYFYDILMGTMFQIDSVSISEILKIFNALLVSLSIPFFYCWIKERLPQREALWATFIIAILPSFMSHFIWSQSLSFILIFPSLYFFERYRKAEDGGGSGGVNEKRNFMILAVLSIATTLITQGSTAAMFSGLMVAYIAAIAISDRLNPADNSTNNSATASPNNKKLISMIAIMVLAVVLALAEFWIPMIMIYSLDKVLEAFTLTGGNILVGQFSDTGGGIIYSPNDFITAPFSSKMDQATGFGIVAAILLLIGIIVCINELRKKNNYELSLAALFMFIYTLVGTMGYALPVHLVPHRFWVVLSIPVAILGAIGSVYLLNYIEKNQKGLLQLFSAIVVLGLLWSSAYPKAVVQTSQWPPGVSWLSQEQLKGYIGLKALPPNTKVFSFCNPEKFADGFDKFGYSWVKEVSDYKKTSITDSSDGNYVFLKKYGYEYATIDAGCLGPAEGFTNEQIIAKINSLTKDNRFSLVKELSNQGFVTMKIN
ncbi:hypothetical protein HY988_05065 [Candidatus Micrarchaeota archaeon]|nr:hypothetical protein [Candidatus Micrarchaeota archaeon]